MNATNATLKELVGAATQPASTSHATLKELVDDGHAVWRVQGDILGQLTLATNTDALHRAHILFPEESFAQRVKRVERVVVFTYEDICV